MKEINLSYVITTYNKLPYLKNVLSTLLKHIKEDEEIVITDAGSTDGTPEYLKKLFSEGKIHQYVSEKDKGEAHGWNKAWLMSKGKLIKIILDDDVFYYPEINKCKDFMLAHPDIDALGTDGLFTKAVHESAFINSPLYSGDYPAARSNYSPDYNAWKDTGKPFDFANLGWMLRKSSIPIFGLCDPTYTRVDAEFAIRLTAGKSNLAWYTGFAWARILNPNSVSVTLNEKIKKDTEKLNLIYPGSNFKKDLMGKKWYDYFLSNNNKILIKKIKNKILNKQNRTVNYIPNEKDWENVWKVREEKLEEINRLEKGKFLYK